MNMWLVLLQNFKENSKLTFYDYVETDIYIEREYHAVTIPRNFADFVLDKFEVMIQMNDENELSEDETDGDEEQDEIQLINDCLAQKCLKIYGQTDYIKFNSISNYAYALEFA
eukprot:292131_1